MGLNPTILRQAQAFAFAFSPSKPPAARSRCYRASGLVRGSRAGKPAFRGCLGNDRSPRYSRRSVESALNAPNDIEIHVFANEARRQALLIAKFDNLGKGASGAAAQNLMLMLGREGLKAA